MTCDSKVTNSLSPLQFMETYSQAKGLGLVSNGDQTPTHGRHPGNGAFNLGGKSLIEAIH